MTGSMRSAPSCGNGPSVSTGSGARRSGSSVSLTIKRQAGTRNAGSLPRPNTPSTEPTLPIQDLGRQLGQAGRSHSFGPWSLVALGQGHFGLLDFFIQSLQQIHPALEQLQYPGTDQLAQLAKGFRPPPILPTPVALAQ